MSVEISPSQAGKPAVSKTLRPRSLLLRRSSRLTLPILLCCAALLWLTPFVWMLSSAFSENSFSPQMASLLPRFPLTLDNFIQAWESADWLRLYANTLFFSFGTFLVQLVTITTAGYVFAYHQYGAKCSA